MLEHLSLHTKVRRLGYLKLLVQQYFDKDFIPISSFPLLFEKIASDYEIHKQLDNYRAYYRKDSNGVIENLRTGSSAEPYIKLAEDLSIIARNNHSYILTKYGKIYKVIFERYSKEASKFKFIEELRVAQQIDLFGPKYSESNVFVLNALDRFFFIKQILEKDFLYFKSLLVVISEHDGKHTSNDSVKYKIVKDNLIGELVNQLKTFQKSNIIHSNLKNRADELQKRLSEKKLQIRSYESIVEPRINWLIDLGLLDGIKHQQNILKLTDAGQVLLHEVKNVFDVTGFIENNLLTTFSKIYKLVPKQERNPAKRIEKYLDFAFINFRTLAPSRITASQAINYISLMCFLREGFILEYIEVKNYIFANDGKGFTIDWFPSENDGSIKKL